MRRLLLLLLPLLCHGQTSNYPAALDTSASLFVAGDNVQTTLAAAMSAVDSTATVASTSGFAVNMIATVCDTQVASGAMQGKCAAWEHMLVTAVPDGTHLTVTRGFGGTSARTHASGKLVSVLIDAAHQQALKSAVIGIETALGANLANVAGYNVTRYTWSQAPGGTLSAGANVITLSPCPVGIAGTATTTYLYISGGVGTAEAVPIIGGSCTSGATTGTLIVTVANSHSGAWTIGTASFGLQEAINAAASAGGGTVTIPPGTYAPHATVSVGSGVRIEGAGANATIIRRTEDYGNTLTIGGPVGSVTDVEISGVQFLHYTGATYGGSSCVNMTPAHPSAAHIESYNCVKCRIEKSWLFNMPYGLKIQGGAQSHYEQNSTLGIWDHANSSCQQSLAAVQINSTSQAYAQLLEFNGNTFGGYGSPARSVTFGTATKTVVEGIGPKYLVQINSCESCRFIGGEMGAGNEYSVYLSPQGTWPMLEVSFEGGIHFDGSRLADFAFNSAGETSGLAAASSISVIGNFFNGESTTLNAIKVLNGGAGSVAPIGMVIANNIINAYAGAGIDIEDGAGYSIAGNIIKGVNGYGGFSTAATASGIYFGGRADRGSISGNTLGGGYFLNAYGAADSWMLYGLYLANAGTWSVCGNSTPVSGGTGTATDLLYQCFNESGGVRSGWGAPNDPNLILSETGANNAIAGALPVPLTTGMRVTLKLAHTLQAGANTFALNGGTAKSIKSSRNIAANIGTAYAANSFVTLIYDGAEWLDVSQ